MTAVTCEGCGRHVHSVNWRRILGTAARVRLLYSVGVPLLLLLLAPPLVGGLAVTLGGLLVGLRMVRAIQWGRLGRRLGHWLRPLA